MAVRGVERYKKTTADAVQQGRESETTYAQRLIPEYVRQLAQAVDDAKNCKQSKFKESKYFRLLKGTVPEEVAYITLRYIFDSLVQGSTVNNLAINLGKRIEDQIRFSLFEKEHKGYYKQVIEDFKRKGTQNYRHMHTVLQMKSEELSMEAGSTSTKWVSWTPVERLHLGCKLLELTIESTGLITKATHFIAANKSEVRVVATPETMQWIKNHMEHAELLHPEAMPCVVPPCDWVGLYDGGYYTPEIRSRVPFVKQKSKAHRLAIKHADFSVAMQSVNKIQQTAWSVNTKVHDVLKEVYRRNLRIGMPASEPFVIDESPVPKDLKKENMTEAQLMQFVHWKRSAARTYTAERERFSKCLQLSRVLQMTEKFRKYKEFWYVYNCDFRGRIYCASPGLSPQGADFSKGLLHFSAGKSLGKDGAYWLAVQGANTFGYDKASYDDRRAWVRQNESAILAAAADPLDSAARSFWSDADKPWQFLAFCFEWAGYCAEGDSFESRIAIALDGSCNGLQNFSAMLRDSVGAQAVNLAASDKPEDIYQRVADVCLVKLQEILDAPELPNVETDLIKRSLARQWLDFGVTRKGTKRPVMTLPYGSTRQSCREYIEEYILDTVLDYADKNPWDSHKKVFEASVFLSKVMWDSIGDVVLAAREAMQYLQQVSKVLSTENIPLTWVSPSGFTVYQGTMLNQSQRVKTQLCGYCYLTVATPTSEVDGRKQALGVSPNFVHSMDAAHLVLTVKEAPDVEAWAMIHDSYGTYAADTEYLHKNIREAFVQMYTKQDVLLEFTKRSTQALDDAYNKAVASSKFDTMDRLEHLALPALPLAGTFDLTEVRSSKYFFG